MVNDVYNAVAAVAGLLTTGMDADDVFAALAHFTHAAHRFEIFDLDGTPTRLLLMKNTAGCNQLINMLVSEGSAPENLVCLLGAEIMDGISTEWIQDVRWEKICGPDTQVIVGGPKHDDMEARLLRAGVRPENLRTQTNYAQLVRDIAAIGKPVTVIANCSTIEALRLELVKNYQPLDYWSE
jgi:UDP-N-acetylmuramyl tripeptide synthase